MITTKRIFYSLTTLIEVGAIAALVLSILTFIFYGMMQDITANAPPISYAFNHDFFRSNNVVIDHLLWFQRNMFFAEINGSEEYLCFRPIAIAFIIISIFACIVAQAYSAYTTFGKMLLYAGKVWWYSFATYYSFITLWWFFQTVNGIYLTQ